MRNLQIIKHFLIGQDLASNEVFVNLNYLVRVSSYKGRAVLTLTENAEQIFLVYEYNEVVNKILERL